MTKPIIKPIVLILALMIFMTQSQAQTSATEDTDLLELLEQLNIKIDRLEAKIDSLEGNLDDKNLATEAISFKNQAHRSSSNLLSQDTRFKVLNKITHRTILENTPSPRVPYMRSVSKLGRIGIRKITPDDGPSSWRLFLNINAEASGESAEPIIWQGMDYEFYVRDSTGTQHTLDANVSMSGYGYRTHKGKSLILRQDQYQYDFNFEVWYRIYLDGKLVHNSKKRLNSSDFTVDRNTRLNADWLKDLEHGQKIAGLPVSIQYSCSKPGQFVVGNQHSNRTNTTKAFDLINNYACLQLQFNNYPTALFSGN